MPYQAQSYVTPPVQPAYPPPAAQGAWAQPTGRELRREQRARRRVERDERRRQRRQELKARAYNGRVYVAAHVTYEGHGVADGGSVDDLDGRHRHAVGSQLGLDLGYESRMNMVFGLGPGLRYHRITHADTDIVDLTINPTFHMTFDMLEIVFPISVGFSLAWDDDPQPSTSPFGTDGAGVVVGVMPGLIFWPTRTFGIYANLGLTGYLLHTGYANRFYTTASDFGVTFAY